MNCYNLLATSIVVLAIGCQETLEFELNEWQLSREPDEFAGEHDDNIFYSAIYFADHEYGWAVGDSGTIINTFDGGNTWNRQSSGTNSDLWTVFFINSLKGWVAGDTTLLTTNNSGRSWLQMHSPVDTGDIITSIAFTDENSGWLIHNGGEVLNTQDGGDTWEVQLIWANEGAGQILFTSKTNGFILNAYGTVLWKTTDGGQSWSSTSITAARWPTDIFFLNDKIGWICDSVLPSSLHEDRTGVYFTDNGGSSWEQIATLDELHLSAIQFINDKVGWITSVNKIYRTDNGGRSWDCEYDPKEEEIYFGFNDLFFIDDTHGWALGFKGGICVYDAR